MGLLPSFLISTTQVPSASSISMNTHNSPAKIPPMLYGTAWKKEKTEELVVLAIKSGFRGIDTACQPKHYFEPGVGAAISQLVTEGVIQRNDIFLQSKFTPLGGQDIRSVPYEVNAPLDEQVRQSFAMSCKNLQTDYLDSLVLHSPVGKDTLIVWREFERIHKSGRALKLGISNCYDLKSLKELYDQAEVKPSFVQNRFYTDTGYDKELRAFCSKNGIIYQSFWTLTANPNLVESPNVAALALKYNKTKAQIWFAFVRSLGITPLTGTTSATHMIQDLDVVNIQLTESEIESISALLY